MIKLKNVSNELEPRTGGSTIDTFLADHPLTNTREWTEEPKDKWTGNVDKKQMKGFDPKDKSTKHHIVIALEKWWSLKMRNTRFISTCSTAIRKATRKKKLRCTTG